jgi:hypothetical protein
VAWLGWLHQRQTGALAAAPVHLNMWAAGQISNATAAASVRRRLSALSSFYRYCAAAGVLADRLPTDGCPPAVDPDYTATAALDRDQALAPVAMRGGGAAVAAEHASGRRVS